MERRPAAFLERQATWRPDEPAIAVDGSDEVLDYAELSERANRFGNALVDAGLRPGDRIAVSLFNTVEFPIVLYGCHAVGVVPVALNYRLSTREFGHIFDEAAPRAVVYDVETADTVEAAVDASLPDALKVSVGGVRPGATAFDDFVADAPTDPPRTRPYSPDDVAYMITTSGTTGNPSVVAYTGAQGWARNRTSIVASETTPDSTWLALLPWFHGGGIDTVLRSSVTAGASIVALRQYGDPERILSAIERHDVTHVMSVPTVTQRVAEFDRVDEYDCSGIECWRHTGEVLTERQVEQFRETLTHNVYNSYGSSEAGLATMLRPSDLPEHAGSVGRPTIGTDLRVVAFDADRPVSPTDTVPPGTEGEVIVRTDQLFRGYYPVDEATPERVRDGWFYTHDVGVVDDDGYLTITGRTDDMILSGGELVSAVEVEDALESHDDVREAIVVGRPDDEWGERVVAYVVLDDAVPTAAESDGPDEAALDAYCKRHDGLADYKRPREYEFVDELPRGETGKKQRADVREWSNGSGA
jgi:long-chain acyl-CoA synthetase